MKLFALPGAASLALLLAAASLDAETARQDGKGFEASMSELNFGILQQNATTRLKLELRNTGETPLTLSSLTCDSLAISFRVATSRQLNVPVQLSGRLDAQLAPGTHARVTVTLDTSKLQPGLFNAAVLAQAGAHQLRLPVKVEVRERKHPTRPTADPARTKPGTPKVDPTGPQPKLVNDVAEHDFGKLLIGESAVCQFKFRNEGEAELVVHNLHTTCNCTGRKLSCGDRVVSSEEIEALTKKREEILRVAPGEEATLEVELQTLKLSPTPKGRPLSKNLTVVTNDLENPRLRLTIKAELESAIITEPTHLRLPQVRRGEPLMAKVLLRSEHIDHYKIVDVVAPAQKGISATWKELEGGDRPVYELQVRVLETAPKGRIADALIVKLDHEKVTEKRIPIYADIISQIEFIGNQERGLTRLDFGVLDGTADSTLELKIENRDGSIPYVPDAVDVSSRNGLEHFRTELVEVEKGVSYVVRLTVSKDIQERFFSGKLRITSAHQDERVRLIDFRGWVKRTEPND